MSETANKKSRITIPILINIAGFILMKVLTKTGIINRLAGPTGSVWVQMILYILIGGFAVYAFRDDLKEALGEWKAHLLKSLLWLAGTLIVAYIAEILGAIPQYLLCPDYVSINDSSVSAVIPVLPAVAGISAIGIFGPMTEESFFRFFAVKRLAGRIPAWLCIVLSSAAFGFMHVKAFTPEEFLFYLPAVMQAAVWAFAMHKSKNITIPLILHVMTNLPAVVMMYLSAGA